jgi:hypothetical protein
MVAFWLFILGNIEGSWNTQKGMTTYINQLKMDRWNEDRDFKRII